MHSNSVQSHISISALLDVQSSPGCSSPLASTPPKPMFAVRPGREITTSSDILDIRIWRRRSTCEPWSGVSVSSSEWRRRVVGACVRSGTSTPHQTNSVK